MPVVALPAGPAQVAQVAGQRRRVVKRAVEQLDAGYTTAYIV